MLRRLPIAVLLLWIAGCSSGSGASGNDAGLNNDNQGGDAAAPSIGVRDCRFSIRLTHDTASSVHLAGSFNGWDPGAWPLDRSGNQWEIQLTADPAGAPGRPVIPPGEHEYKLVVDGGAEWLLDPANPLTRFDDPQQNENSLLIVEDCMVPRVSLQTVAVDYATGSIAFEVRIEDGAAELGLGSVEVLRGGVPEVADVDLATGIVRVDLSGLSPDKHTFAITATDNGGRTGILRSPVWLEPEPFTWEDLTLYSIFVDRFQNGDPANDGIAGVHPLADWHGGDWAGITQKLREGFFEELGITALWISTPMDNPDAAYDGDCNETFTGYHAYWVQAAREVENHFGTAAELRELVAEAHRRGIRVMIDWAANHLFIDHPLYQGHAGDPLWFNFPASTDPAQLGENRCGVLPNGWNDFALECWFTEYLPDMNHRNHELVRQLTEDALWWIREFDLDGFRVDATKHIRPSYLRYLRYRLDREVSTWYTPFYLVGENFIYDYALIARNISPDELQGQFDFPLYGSVRWAFGDNQSHFDELNSFVYGNFIDAQSVPGLDWAAPGPSPDGTLMGIFLGNHDVTRFSSQIAGQEDPGNPICQAFSASPPQPADDTVYHRMRLAFAFLLTVRGLPVIYYGDEIGLAGVHDPDNRRDMIFDLASLSPAQQQLRDAVGRLGQLRRDHSALRRGRYDAFWGEASCLVYAKAGAQETLLVVLAGDQGCNASVPIKGGFGILEGDGLLDILPETGGDLYPVNGMSISIGLPPFTVQILAKQ